MIHFEGVIFTIMWLTLGLAPIATEHRNAWLEEINHTKQV